MKKHNRLLTLAGIIALVCALLVSSVAMAEKQTVKVAVMCPMSGQASRFSEIYKASIEAAVRAMNEDNYLPNYELEFEFIDDKGSTDGAPQAATLAIDQYGCNVSIGHMLTTMIQVSGTFFEEAEVPLLGIVSGPAAVSNGWDYLCIETGTDLQQADTLAKYLVEERGAKKIGMIHVNTDGGIAAANELETYLAANYDMKLVTRDQLGTEDTDFTAQVLNLKNAEADCVIFWGLTQAQGQICYTQIKQLYRDDILFAGGSNLAQAQMLDAWNEQDIQGVVFPTGYLPTEDPAVVRFQQYFKEADVQHQDAADVPARVFDAVYHIATALNNMGEQDVNSDTFNQDLAVALRQASFDGVQGHFDFSAFDNGVGLGIMNIGMWGEGYSQSKVYPN